MTVAQLAFRATCKRGHDLETFTDRKAFEAHMRGHKARKLSPATGPGNRKGGLPAKYLTPNRAPKGTEGLTKVLVEHDHWGNAAAFDGLRGVFAGVADDWTTDERVTADKLRPGDVFELGRIEYTVLEVHEDTWTVSLERNGETRSARLGEAGASKLRESTVVIVKRAA